MAPRLLYAIPRNNYPRIILPHVHERIQAVCDVIPAPVPGQSRQGVPPGARARRGDHCQLMGTPAIRCRNPRGRPRLKLVGPCGGDGEGHDDR